MLVVHGFKGWKDFAFLPAVADRLATAGFLVASLTTSGAGYDADGAFAHPDQFRRNTLSADLEDAARVLAALEEGGLGVPPPGSIGLLGFSRGGAVAVLLAARGGRVRALATWAAMAHLRRWSDADAARWREQGEIEVTSSRTGQRFIVGTELLEEAESPAGGQEILRAAGHIQVPWLVAHGTADETIPPAEGRELAEAGGAMVTPLWIEHADHHFGAGHPFGGMTPALSRVLDATVRHFARHLG